jgi:hypothetical protein
MWGTGAARFSHPGVQRGPDADGASAPRGGPRARSGAWVRRRGATSRFTISFNPI